ncbi:MAG: YHYH protein [Bacteroidetes bacterium]|nr:YHYH protein [Bacteroidota bacterium]
MKKGILITTVSFLITLVINAQSPSLSAWLRNSTITARHYDKTTGALITDASLANVQSVKYTTTDVYISTTGLPAYITGPFLDGNTNVAGNQNAIFKLPLSPTKNTGTPTATTGGNIGLFINGVALFDYRDGVSWNNAQSKVCGGPIMGCTGDGVWNRDAVVGEKTGFDCSKGHPAGTNYHHHQNPSAFNLALNIISTICNLYASDGLYVIDASKHSPLIGFAYDGFPIYGAYAYKDTNGTGAIVRMKSSYFLRNITTRTTNSVGTTVTAGPVVSGTYPLGYFREDYQYITPSAGQTDYLDEHNGRFCKTPEYPNGTYCYFATVDVNHNSAYPYVVGPTFYGNKVVTKVTTIPGGATTYTGPILSVESIDLNGFLNDKGTVLNWTTTNEKDVKYFAIETGNDGISFSKVGEVASNSYSQNNNKYSFTDLGTFINTKYYRIKVVDINGKYSYSKVISFHQDKAIDISIFPNPVADILIMQANGIVKNSMEITLANSTGQIIKKQQFLQGSTIAYLETKDCSNGTYFISVNDGLNKKVYKIIIQH